MARFFDIIFTLQIGSIPLENVWVAMDVVLQIMINAVTLIRPKTFIGVTREEISRE